MDRKYLFTPGIIGSIMLLSAWTLYAQQYRTDVLFMQHRESTKKRMLLKRQKELQRQNTYPVDVEQFIDAQNYNHDRLQFNAANNFLDSREAAKKQQTNWNSYLEEKAEAEARLRKGRDLGRDTPKSKTLEQIRRDYLAKEKQHRDILRKRPAARQSDAAKRQSRKKESYASFVAQKKLHSTKKTTGTPGEVQRKLYSAKTEEFNNFNQVRRKIKENIKSGTFAQEQERDLSAKRAGYQAFTQKHKKDRDASDIADLSPEQLLGRKFKERAKEFQNYVSIHKKNYADIKILQNNPSAYYSKIAEADRPKYQKFIGQQQEKLKNANVFNLSGAELARIKYGEKAPAYQAYMGDQKRRDSTTEGRGLDAAAFQRKNFQENQAKYRTFVESSKKNRSNAGTEFGLTAEEIQRKKYQAEAPNYARFVKEKKQQNAQKEGGGKDYAAILQDTFRRKSSDFQDFLKTYKNKGVAVLKGEDGLLPEEVRKRQAVKYKQFNETRKQLSNRVKAEEDAPIANNTASNSSGLTTPQNGQRSVQNTGSSQSQRFETRALNYKSFLLRRQTDRARALVRIQNQQRALLP
ncbi:MAG: hypothetical protein HQM13_22270 [SAR324 cluster bacterium]|nr:hypothetical protein [SAR324 cluster bacterium]